MEDFNKDIGFRDGGRALGLGLGGITWDLAYGDRNLEIF